MLISLQISSNADIFALVLGLLFSSFARVRRAYPRKVSRASAREMYRQHSRSLRSLVRLFLFSCRSLSQMATCSRVLVFLLLRGQSRSMAKRPAHSLHLPDGSKERLLEDAKHFLSPQTRRWYQDHGVPYRRGWLLSGIPGSGKTSLVHVVASELELPIYTISLCSKRYVEFAS